MLMLVSGLEVTGFAAALSNKSSASFESIVTKQNNINIEEEITSKRTAYSKVYRLEDGSYYQVSTRTPIHKKMNGSWENISSKLENTLPRNTVEADSILGKAATTNSTVLTRNVTRSSEDSLSPVTTKEYDCEEYLGGGLEFTRNSKIFIKSNEIANYLSENKTILDVKIVLECFTDGGTNRVYVRENTNDWYSITDENNDIDYTGGIIDCIDINTDGTYYIDITDIFYRWEKGSANNNGIVLYATEDCNFSVDITGISIQYDEIDVVDVDYTYHTIKMDKAGTLHVNDFTNTIVLEQELLDLNLETSSLILNRFYSSVRVNAKNGAGIGFVWNFSSRIEYQDEIYTWTLLDGSVRHFKRPKTSDIITNGNHEKWIEYGSYIGDASLWLISPDDHANVFIELDGTTYRFNSSGYLTSITTKDQVINIQYESDNIKRIVADNSIIEFTYEENKNSTTGSKPIAKIELFDSTFGNKTITFTTDKQNRIPYHRTTYDNGKTVCYMYDNSGNLTSIILNNEIQWDLTYIDGRSNIAKNSRRLSSCKKYKLVNGEKQPNDPGECLLSIDSNKTYQRVFTSDNSSEETLFFDKNLNIVSHKMADGKYVFASYDNTGNLSTYFVSKPNETDNFLLNHGFESYVINDEGTNISNWTKNNPAITISSLSTENKALCIQSSSYIDGAHIEQMCNGPFIEDQTYIFGAWVQLDENAPTNSEKGLKLNLYSSNSEGICDRVNGLVASIDFGACARNEWVYRLTAFKLEDNHQSLFFSIEYDGPETIINVDDVKLYKAEISNDDIPGITTSTIGESIRNEDGSISEVLSDDVVSMIKSYEYDDSDRVTSMTDHNGITTYYKYNNKNELIEIGNSKTGDTIVNPTRFTYIEDLSKTIQQTVTDITTGNPIDIVAEYSYVDNKIEIVTHNGISYHFEYVEGVLNRIYTETLSDSNSSTSHTVVDYDYADNNIGEIRYANGLTVSYTYSDDMISQIQYSLNDGSQPSIVKTLNYSYVDGLLNVTDSQSKTRTVYTDTGYKIYRDENNEQKLLYVLENNPDGSTTETYCPDTYISNDVCLSQTSTSKTTTDYNAITKHTTDSSSFSVKKIVGWENESDYTTLNYNYNRQSITDYFGRIVQKDVELETLNKNEKKTRLTETYSYKELGNGITSNLISSYSTVITEENAETPFYAQNLMYEYDEKGNIVLVYVYEDNIKTPLVYYAYDEANQIQGEINYSLGISVTYAYDEGGNLKSKQNHLISEALVDGSTNKIISYGSETDCHSFQFDANKLISYDNHNITYDSLGNPLKYYGTLYDVSSTETNPIYTHNTIEGELEWLGNKLTAFESDDIRCEYFYDENGYRIKKVKYEKSLNNNDFEYVFESETFYIWDNGVLKSVILDSDESEPMRSDIIYDQEGQIAGFVSYAGYPVFFVKDLNGSVKQLITNDGEVLAYIDYDAWGTPLITIPAEYSSLAYIIYGMLTVINPIAYNGYLFDYDTGLYFCREKLYSPTWGRYLNTNEIISLLEPTNTALSANLYSFCNNNPVNIIEPYSAFASNKFGFDWTVNGIEINMSDAFLSRPFCMIFSNQLLKTYGTWSYGEGHNYFGMNSFEIAATLFAKNVGKSATYAINRVNACWGDGWIMNNKNANFIILNPNDENYWKYEKIWYAALDIKMYAWSQGIYITI